MDQVFVDQGHRVSRAIKVNFAKAFPWRDLLSEARLMTLSPVVSGGHLCVHGIKNCLDQQCMISSHLMFEASRDKD
jgi:hypothetical protein